MIVSRSGTIYAQSTTLTLDGTVPKETDDLVILGMTLDAKLTIEKHLRLIPELQISGYEKCIYKIARKVYLSIEVNNTCVSWL